MAAGKSSSWIKVLLTGMVFAVALGACSHTAQITTEPEGADIWVNGIYIGQTPTHYESRSGTPATYYVRIEKEGYKPIKAATIESSYRADISLALLILAIVPYFFSARLEDQYKFDLFPINGRQPAEKTPVPAKASGPVTPEPAEPEVPESPPK